MGTLVSPGVQVTVTDESQFATNDSRDTVPLVVVATAQDKANASGTGTARFTTKAEANDPKLITSPRELIQEFGNPIFFDVNGTVQQGFELNEYGLLAAFKALNITNRVWVIRGDIDLNQLVASSVAPADPPPDGTYWLDLGETEFGLFKFTNNAFSVVSPTVFDDASDLSGAAPDDSLGKEGDVGVVVVVNGTTGAKNKFYEKINGNWLEIGSTAWNNAKPTTAIGTTSYTDANSTTLAGLPQGGETFSVEGTAGDTFGPITVAGGFDVVVQSSLNFNESGNTLGLKTFTANTETITFVTSGASIALTGTVTHGSGTAATASSVGDILRITDTGGTDDATLRIRRTGADFFPTAAGSESFEINNQTVSTGGGLADAAAAAVAINAVVGSGGSSPQGITASAVLDAGQDETNYDGAGSNGTFAAGSGYSVADVITLSDGSTITVDAVSVGAVTQFTVTTADVNGFTSLSTLTQSSVTPAGGTGFTLTPAQANVVLSLIKDTAVSGEALPDQLEVDLTNLNTAFETTPTEFPAATAADSSPTNLSITEVVEAINDQVVNTNDLVASAGGSNELILTDSTAGNAAIQVSSVSGAPVADFGLPAATAVSASDVSTQFDTLTNVTSTVSDGNDIALVKTTGTLNITGGTALSELGFVVSNNFVSLSEAVLQYNNADVSSEVIASVETVGSLNFMKLVDQNNDSELTVTGSGAQTLGIDGVYATDQIFYAPHTSVPQTATEGDFWVKTTTPNNGADYVVKIRDNSTGQWVTVEAPMLAGNVAAFDDFGTALGEGDLYVDYPDSSDPITPTDSNAHLIKRYNGATELRLTSPTGTTYGSGTFDIGNGRDSLVNVSGSGTASSWAAAINAADIDNITAELVSGELSIVNTAGEDIILANGSLGQVNITDGQYSNWVPLWTFTSGVISGYTPSFTAPTTEPAEGTLWYDADIGINDFDILEHDGSTWITYTGDIQVQATKPTTQSDGSSALVDGDLWIDTSDLEEFPIVWKFNGSTGKFVLVDNTDQTTQDGILFADAREDASSQLDPDTPNPLLFPQGMILWNTRASSLVVKEWRADWFDSSSVEGEVFQEGTDFTNETYDVGNTTLPALSDASRWVTVSGNRTDGSPYMGRFAQRIMVVKAMGAALNQEELRDPRRRFFNLMMTPGYPELLDEMVTLNVDRRETTFIIGDTPFRLSSSSTALQDWATNANNAASNGDDGLVTRDEHIAVYYPSMGLTTNLDGNEVAMPSSLGALYAYLFNDNVAFPWFAPAGLNRGLLSGVFTSVGILTSEDEFRPVNLSRGQQDALYTNNINPIVFTPGRGLYVNGQKTLSPVVSALDRVNVMRLIVFLRFELELLAEEFLFEINDEITRDQVQDTFDRFFGDLLGLRAIFDYLVVVDETNNTPERIDRNELWIDVAIQPAKVAEFIFIPIRVKNTGEDLTV